MLLFLASALPPLLALLFGQWSITLLSFCLLEMALSGLLIFLGVSAAAAHLAPIALCVLLAVFNPTRKAVVKSSPALSVAASLAFLPAAWPLCAVFAVTGTVSIRVRPVAKAHLLLLPASAAAMVARGMWNLGPGITSAAALLLAALGLLLSPSARRSGTRDA